MVFCYFLGFFWIVVLVVLVVLVYFFFFLYFVDFIVIKNGVDIKCIYLVYYGKYNIIRWFMFVFLLKLFVYELGMNIDFFFLFF